MYVEIEGIKINDEKTYQVIKRILKRKEGRPTQKTVLLLRLFAEGNINAKELETLNHFDILDQHKRKKMIKAIKILGKGAEKYLLVLKNCITNITNNKSFLIML